MPPENDQSGEKTTPLAQRAPEETPTVHVPMVTFEEGAILAGRYRVIQRLGQGGMGEVYKAEDLELHETNALKTVLPEVAKDEHAMQRFKREIQLARRVTHPNVCRIFDVFYHSAGDARLAFVTMELLSGETLTERIRRAGRLTPEESLPIIMQMAAGLEAAHNAGVVHRDFKSGNVMLVPSLRDPGSFRAVITDFGLARQTESEVEQAGITSTGAVVGTPAYMAPEQLEGADPTPSIDIYALGIVMYEMVTGTWPFKGGSSISVALRRLKEPAPSPRVHVPGLDARWEQVILRCLERDPARRFAHAIDVARSLEIQAPIRKAGRPAQRPQAKWIAAALAALVLAVIAFYVVPRAGFAPRVGPAAAATVKPRPSVAVLGFKNLSGNAQAAWLSGALGEMLTSELGANEKLRTISGETVARLKRDLALPDTDALDKPTLGRIRSNGGSDYVLLGSFFETPSELRVDLRLQDTKTGESVGSVIVTGTERGLLDLVSRAGAQIRQKLGVGTMSQAQATSALAALPANADLARLYSDGVAKLRWSDALSARDLLISAISIDPKYPLAHGALSVAWSALGYDAKARDEARLAFQLSTNLPREDRLLTEGRFREVSGEHGRAIDVFHTLSEFFPDNVEYGLDLTHAQIDGGHAREALKTIDQLRRLPSPLGDDIRIDIAEADAAEALSDYKRALAAASKAANRAVANGATILLAKSLNRRGSALQRLGENANALDAFEQARRIYDGAGDIGAAARCLSAIGNVHVNEGKLAEAKVSYEAALAVHRKIGDDGGAAAALNNLAIVATQQGDLPHAKALYEEALALQRKTADQKSESQTLNQLGSLALAAGDLQRARTLFEQALTTGEAVGDKFGVANVLGNLGNLAYSAGALTEARRDYDESLRLARETGVKSVIAGALNSLGTVNLDEGDLTAALKNYQESLAIARQSQDAVGQATGLSNIALVQMWQGDLGSARHSFDDALKRWNEIGDKGLMAYALTDYSTLLLQSGDVAAARARSQEALTIRQQLKDPAAAQNQVGLALVALESNDSRASAAMARPAAEAFAAAHAIEDESNARIVYARALAAGGDARRAVDEARRASALAAKTSKLWLRLSISIAANRLIGMNAHDTAGANALQNASKEAQRHGFVGLDLDARIALAEIDARWSKSPAARNALAQLAGEANRHGLMLLGKRAMSAMGV